MTPTAAPVRTHTGGISLPSTVGTITAAEFRITGTANYTYSITLPAGAITIDDNAGNTMTVNSWTSTPAKTGTISGSGSETLYVGGTLNVVGTQKEGVYNSDTYFDVTVDYN